MKILQILVLLTTLSPSYRHAQPFCGVITYKHSYYKVSNKKEVRPPKGSCEIEEFFICGNNLKVIYDGVLSNVYHGDSNVYYLLYPHENRGTYIKADSLYGDTNDSFVKLDSLPYKDTWYKAIRHVNKKGSLTYYYKPEISVDPTAFANCKFLEWAHFFDTTNGGLRLIGIEKHKNLYSVSEAIEIRRIDLGPSDFDLPPDYKIDKPDYIKIPPQ